MHVALLARADSPKLLLWRLGSGETLSWSMTTSHRGLPCVASGARVARLRDGSSRKWVEGMRKLFIDDGLSAGGMVW